MFKWRAYKCNVCAKLLQSSPTLCDPVTCSPPGFSVHGILQARTLSGCRALLQGIFPTQGSNPSLPYLHWQVVTLPQAFLTAQLVKNLPAVWETWVQSLGWEDPLEKEMATHSSVLAWRIPWMEEPGGLQSMESQKSQTWLSNFTSLHFTKHSDVKYNLHHWITTTSLTLRM